jgi:hypothetical protein
LRKYTNRITLIKIEKILIYKNNFIYHYNEQMQSTHIKHNDILDKYLKVCDKKLTKKIIYDILVKYNIDINYDNSLFLFCASTSMGDDTEEPNYKNIKLLLKSGADPKLMMDKDILYEIHPINQIRLDAVFRIYGYKCKWYSESVDFEKYGEKLLYETDSD